VRFTSIYPACYPGRWPHVHFEVYPGQASITNVFGDDGGAGQLGTVTGDADSGYTVALTVGVDTTTAPAGR
jgi:protocatechuate 3,4-dioxygenase beta subunit